MAIYAPPPPPFSCAICHAPRMQGTWDKHLGADTPIPPLCRSCERNWGKAVHPGHWQDRNRNRRMIRQISALAEVILATAHCHQNGNRGPHEQPT
jgi:hypothetical protein